LNRSQLEHVIRAAIAMAEDPEIIVIGSQAILGAHPKAIASDGLRSLRKRGLASRR
jgi:hypothetical protein